MNASRIVHQAMQSEVAPGNSLYRIDIDDKCRVVLMCDTNFQTPDETRRVALFDEHVSTTEANFISDSCNAHARSAQLETECAALQKALGELCQKFDIQWERGVQVTRQDVKTARQSLPTP